MATASVTNTFVTGTAAEAAQVNTNFTDLVAFLNNSAVHLDGSKAMTSDFDVGSQKIVNLAAGTASTDAVNKSQLDAVATLGVVAYSTVLTSSTSTTSDVAVRTATWTAVAGRLYRISWYEPRVLLPATNGGAVYLSLRETNAAGTVINSTILQNVQSGYGAYMTGNVSALVTGSGSVTYVGCQRATVLTGAPELSRASTYPGIFVVEDIGEA